MGSDSDSSWETDSEDEIEETSFGTNTPKPIKLETWINSAEFHPTEKLLVAGDLDGVVKAWSFDNESEIQTTELKLSGKAHDDSIRAVHFSKSGKSLFSIGNDKQLLVSDVETGRAILSITSAFEESPYCMNSCNDNVIATGDEGGIVRLFDIRKKNPVDELLIDDGRCEDTINDIYIGSDGKYLVAASADGTLCAYNCKRKMFLHESESMGAELCSITTIKNEKKAVVSCADGSLHIYNWGEFGLPSDIFPGHDKGDLVCCRLLDNVVLTGDYRGNIRPVNLQPNRIMGILGVHQKNAPIECLDVFDETIALSVGTGSNEIRFWNCSGIKSIMEGSKAARSSAKKAKKNERITETKKSKFYKGFENDFENDIDLTEKLHSSDEEENGPRSSDSLSDSEVPPEASTSELDSDADKTKTKEEKTRKEDKECDSMKNLMNPPQKRKGSKYKNKKKKKVFKPLIP